MKPEKSGSLQVKKMEKTRSNEIISKIAATQNVIKNKFSKAIANRLEHEKNLNQTMQPLLTTSSDGVTSLKNESESLHDNSLRNLSNNNKNKTHQFRLATKSYLNHAMQPRPMITAKHDDNANELCDRLRLLLTSMIPGDVEQAEEINAIIMKLRRQGIIE